MPDSPLTVYRFTPSVVEFNDVCCRYTQPVLKLLNLQGARTLAIAGRAQSLFFNTTCFFAGT
eukprot:185748-Prorocentrum_minimum.AAC.1